MVALITVSVYYFYKSKHKKKSPYIPGIQPIEIVPSRNQAVKGFFDSAALKALYRLITMDDKCANMLPVNSEIVDKLNIVLSSQNAVPFDLTIPISPTHFPDDAQFQSLLSSVNVLEDVLQQSNFTIPDCWIEAAKKFLVCPILNKYSGSIGAAAILVINLMMKAVNMGIIHIPPCIELLFCEIQKCINNTPGQKCNAKCDWAKH